jgi:hypothetical protein
MTDNISELCESLVISCYAELIEFQPGYPVFFVARRASAKPFLLDSTLASGMEGGFL